MCSLPVRILYFFRKKVELIPVKENDTIESVRIGTDAELFMSLIPRIKYMKSSASESVENGCFNLERLSRSSRLAQPGISALERL